MANDKNHNDYKEDSTMREIHRIQEEMEQQYEKSGLSSYWEWLQATEADMHKSLAEDGFEIVTRDGRTFLDEIKPSAKRPGGKNKIAKTGTKKNSTFISSPRFKTAKHKNYDDIENLAVQEFQGVREERASADKIEPQAQKKPIKYKTTAKRRAKNRRTK